MIIGSDLADAGVKAASIHPPAETRLPYTDCYPNIGRQILAEWQTASEGLRELKEFPSVWFSLNSFTSSVSSGPSLTLRDSCSPFKYFTFPQINL